MSFTIRAAVLSGYIPSPESLSLLEGAPAGRIVHSVTGNYTGILYNRARLPAAELGSSAPATEAWINTDGLFHLGLSGPFFSNIIYPLYRHLYEEE